MLAAVVVQMLASGNARAAASCNLSGEWRAVRDDTSTYIFRQDAYGNLTAVDQPATAQHWHECVGRITPTGAVTLSTDTGHMLHGNVNSNCSLIPWTYGPPWCRSNSADCGHSHPSPSPSPDEHRITHVHVVAMNHLDVGFSCAGCDPEHRDPYTWALLNVYMNKFFPASLNTSMATNGNYVYTTHCWLISFFFECPHHAAANPSFPIQCPSPALVAAVTDAISKGWITWHAFPLNAEPEIFDTELFGAGVDLCHSLADRFNMSRPTVLSQRDVPGLTRAVIPPLVARGVRALSIGANTFSASAMVPRIYRWMEPQTKSSLIALQHPGGYGDGSTVLVNGSTHALHLLFNGDNAGPHSSNEVVARHQKLAAEFPNATIFGASWDSFIDALVQDGSAVNLPEKDKEEGDTWIYGVQQDLYKTAATRAILRARRDCTRALGHVCLSNATSALRNSTRFALKLGEHT
eukprot:SAG31_NODE_3284_length_4464_cov_5.447194_2_plen_464_part_00